MVAASPSSAPGPADPPAPTFPLRAEQRRMWLLEHLHPGRSQFNLGFAVRHGRPLDVDRFRAALDSVVARHPALRARIRLERGRPVQEIGPAVGADLRVDDVVGASDDELRARADAFVGEPFALERGPLVRFLVLRRADDDVVVVVAIHHIISDLWSLAVLGREVADAYEPGPERRRPARQRSFEAFVADEAAHLRSDAGRRSLAFWHGRLADAPDPVDLAPLVPPSAGGPSARIVRRIEADQVAAWRRLGDAHGASLHDTVLAGYAAVLHRYTGESDLVVGTYRANRTPRDVETIGCLRNAVALRIDVDGGAPFGDLVDHVVATTAATRAHQRVPLQAVLDDMRRSGGGDDPLAASALLTTTFQWHKTSRMVDPHLVSAVSGGDDAGVTAVGRVEVRPFDLGVRRASADLALEVHPRDDALDLVLEYDVARLDPGLVARFGDHLTRLLSAASTSPPTPVDDLDMLSPAEHAEMRAEWRSADADHGPPTTVAALLAARLEAAGDAVAVRAGAATMTDRELAARVTEIVGALRAAGVGPGDRVGIHLEPGLDLPAVLVAVVSMGAAYVALDPDAPAPRLAMLAGDAGVGAVVTDGPAAAVPWSGVEGPPVVVVSLDGIGADHAQEHGDRSPEPVAPADLVYVSFTSGSTGRPKPVGVTHANAVNFLRAVARRPGFAADDVMLALTGLTFDISFAELFLPLVTGGTVVVADRGVAADAAALRALVQEAGVTVVQTTPTIWQRILDGGPAPAPVPRVWCGGEAMPGDLADRLLDATGEVWNLYGPTETTVWSSAWKVTRPRPVSIGTPLDNTSLYVLGPRDRPQPVGAIGELHIGGAGVTPGYLGLPDRTADAFLPDPFSPGNGRMYRTGDLAVRAGDGRIHLLGRTDDQIKLHGQRIEPGEVEAALAELPEIRAAAVVARDDHLVAFVEARAELDPVDIRRRLAARLPISLVPAHVERVDALPLTPSDKIDRRELRRRPLTPLPVEYVAPRAGTETRLAELWAAILDVDRVGRDDDFFAAGGDSLDAIRAATEIEAEWGCPYRVTDLIRAPTVARTAELLALAEGPPAFSSLVTVRGSGSGLPFFYAAAPMMPTAASLVGIAAHAGDRPFHLLQPKGLEDDAAPHQRLEDEAAHYVAEIRSVQPLGPYALGGHCGGSWVAIEVARQLESAGERVELLVLVDAVPPTADAGRTWRRRAARVAGSMRFYLRSGRVRSAVAWQWRMLLDRIGRGRLDPTVRRRARRVARAHREAHQRYTPAMVEGPVLLVLSEQFAGDEPGSWRARWQPWVRGEIRVRTVPGAHSSLTDPVPVAALGGHIDRALADAAASAGGGL